MLDLPTPPPPALDFYQTLTWELLFYKSIVTFSFLFEGELGVVTSYICILPIMASLIYCWFSSSGLPISIDFRWYWWSLRFHEMCWTNQYHAFLASPHTKLDKKSSVLMYYISVIWRGLIETVRVLPKHTESKPCRCTPSLDNSQQTNNWF